MADLGHEPTSNGQKSTYVNRHHGIADTSILLTILIDKALLKIVIVDRIMGMMMAGSYEELPDKNYCFTL